MSKLDQYADLLLQWNKTHNLSGALDRKKVQENIADSLRPLSFIAPFNSAIDIGSGAGFPAIPLAIQNPQSVFFLTEPRKKRASFLEILRVELGLKNLTLFPCTIQEAKIPHEVELIISRAVGSVEFLISVSSRFLLPNGAFLFYKGSKILQEESGIRDNELFTSPSQRVYFYRRK